MQIALQDIRVLGYKKIIRYYSGDRFKRIMAGIEELDCLYYDVKIAPYSLLNKWKLLSEIKDRDEIRGYSLLVYSLEPMIDFEIASDASKRKCRNTWNSLWVNFGTVFGLESWKIMRIRDVGLKILFIYANYCTSSSEISAICKNNNVIPNIELLEDILDFYNTVLIWSVFSQQESNFTKNNLSFLDILSMLVVDTDDEFKSDLSKLY